MPENSERPRAEVQDLSALVAYQPGSVVSRMLLKKPSGSVTLFAFARGEGLSEHTAPFDALVYVAEGEAEITIGGTPYRVGEGQTITLPAGVPHAVHAAADFKMMLVMLRA